VTEHSPDCRGHFWRDASGRLVYELHHLPASCYRDLSWLLSGHFGLQSLGGPDVLLDEAAQDYKSEAGSVSFEWDNWTEFTVVAKDARSESLVQAIGAFLGSSATVD
jgi:hypothetical protein